MAPAVSVIIPTHNSPDTLALAIRSVLHQTAEDFELIVVGDGCIDHTAAVVAGFEDERVHWLDLPKAPGYGYANRNTALERTTGDLITYLAHDDLWTVDHLELLQRTIGDRGVDFAYSRVLTVDEKGNMWPTTCNLESLGAFDAAGPESLVMGIGSVMYRRSLHQAHGWWDQTGTAGGDHRLWLELMRGVGIDRVAFVPEATSLHFVAEWRRKSQPRWAPSRATVFRRTGVYRNILPPILRVDVPPGLSEQQAVWDAMQPEPRAWAIEMRRAVTAVLDARLSRQDDSVSLLLGSLGSGFTWPLRKVYGWGHRRMARRHRPVN